MNKTTILWADDDRDDLETFHDVMREINAPHEVVTFSNGKEVLDYLSSLEAEAHPCLIILDMNMPVLDGRETLAILKKEQEYRSIPVVVFTTSGNEQDKSFCSRHETAMLTKPPTYRDLKETVQTMLSHCLS